MLIIRRVLLILVAVLPTMTQAGTRTEFFHDGQQLLAYYESPLSTPKGVVVFVHGDGAMPYDAHGYYLPIWDRLLSSGYAVFSWDKQGVGSSTGNWLEQSMSDRQREVLAAIEFLKTEYDFRAGDFGLLGFSQAGWVVPAVAAESKDVAFVVGVGFAINWVQQGRFLTEKRLESEGASKQSVAEQLSAYESDVEFLAQKPSYEAYRLRVCCDSELMSRDRFGFVVRNIDVDATKSLAAIQQPVLLILGREDRNVNVVNTSQVAVEVLSSRNNLDLHLIDDATHGLLKHPQYSGKPGIGFMLRLLWEGDKAFAPGALEVLENWLLQLH